MLEPGQHLRPWRWKREEELFVGNEFRWEEFDRHGPIQRGLNPLVNRAHAAVANEALDAILRKKQGENLRVPV